MTVKEMDQAYIANTYARFPLVLKEGKGSYVRDENGKEYIDLETGIAVNSFGIADEAWKSAVIAQLSMLQHTSNLYFSEPCAKLAALLCKKTGMKKVFFSNSGAEANECAIKAARKYAADKYGPARHQIIVLNNSFHGRTITTLAATGQETYHHMFQPLTAGFLYADPTLESVRSLVNSGNVAAIMFEPVMGEGGILPLDAEFIRAIAEFAQTEDILLIVDEVQSGNGRTGLFYGYMNFGITPDIVTTAKGLAGGLPLGATLFGEKVQNVFSPGDHGSTFGGNPVCCAGAVSILERIDEELLAEVREKSEYIVKELTGAKGIIGVSGMGLMLGIQTEKDASKVIQECMERGVLVIKAKTKVRLLPALNIPWEALKKAVGIIKEVCEK